MSPQEPLDEELARAIALALEAELAFGTTALPRGPRGPLIERGAEPLGSAVDERDPSGTAGNLPGPELQPAASGSLADIAEVIAACQACGLAAGRCRTVPGEGSPRARLMFVGEAPGADEDASGRPFVGRAGQLLTKMIEAMGLDRDQVFIANVLKCRPPENRRPQPDEIGSCRAFLDAQIALVNPELICALGATAAAVLLETEEGIGRLRGRIHDFRGRQLLATYHPSYLLREPAKKRDAWQDLQLAMKILNLEPPPRGTDRA